MSGSISTGGLISGIDTNTLIQQLLSIERQKITRVENRVSILEQQKTDILSVQTQLRALDTAVDALKDLFDEYSATTSDDEVATAEVTGSNPVSGSYTVNVVQLATATSARSSSRMGGSIDPGAALSSSGIAAGVTEGVFTINGVAFTVDPSTDSLNSILAEINSSTAGVTATYDSATDTVTFTNSTAGDTSVISFGIDGDDGTEDSNFLNAIRVTGAYQGSAGDGTTTVQSSGNLGAVNPLNNLSEVNFANGGTGAVTAGSFSINGISITIDPTSDSIVDVVNRINDSDAGVTASYDSSTDSIQVVSNNMGSRTIRFGSSTDTSNFLDITNLTVATQTAGKDSQFTINGGATLTRSTNSVSDAVGGVTIDLLSVGEATVTIDTDDEALTDGIQAFLDEVNSTLTLLDDLTAEGATLESDQTIKGIESSIKSMLMSMVSGSGSTKYTSLISIGISTGNTFDAEATTQYELDADAFREALNDERTKIKSLFTNGNSTGVADLFSKYVDGAVSYSGFLNRRTRSNGTIDNSIETYNNRIDSLELRLDAYEARLRSRFSAMETTLSNLQQQNSSLTSFWS